MLLCRIIRESVCKCLAGLLSNRRMSDSHTEEEVAMDLRLMGALSVFAGKPSFLL